MRAGLPCLLIAVLLAGAGCGDRLNLKPTRLSFDQFVNATVELRRAAVETDNPAAFQVRKREIQRRLNFTDDDLREFSRAHASDITVLSAAWDSVEARLDRPPTATKAAPAGATPTAMPATGRKPGANVEVVPGALPGGLPAVVQHDSLTPPPDDTVRAAPSPGYRPPAKKPRSFY